MLEALVEHGISPDFLVGTSAGALNAAYFAGRPDLVGVRALGEVWRGVESSDVFPGGFFPSLFRFFASRNYLVDSEPLRRVLTQFLPYRDLDEAAVPVYVVAADILTGQEVVLSSGPAVEALMASAAIPAVFPPVHLGGRYLVDGAIANHTPISVAVEQGASFIVVLPTGFSCEISSPPESSVAMALHALNLLIAQRMILDVERYGDVVDLRIVPPLCPVKTGAHDFSRIGALIDRAVSSTTQWIERGGLDTSGVPPQLRPHSHPHVV
jgi:NTE family protein